MLFLDLVKAQPPVDELNQISARKVSTSATREKHTDVLCNMRVLPTHL